MKPVSECFKISFFVLIVAGVWYPPSLENSRYVRLVNIYRVLAMITICIGMLSIQFVYFFTSMQGSEPKVFRYFCGFVALQPGYILSAMSAFVRVVGVDLDKTIDATALFTFVGHLFKTLTVIKNRKRINDLLKTIDDEEDKDELMQNMATKLSLVSKIYNGGAGLTAVMWNLIPFTKPTLTLPFYYPDLPSSSPWFVSWYAYQTIILIINGVAQTSADHVFGGLMAFAATQLKLLQHKLETIGRKETELDADQKEQDDYNKAVSCVRFHLKIIRVVDELTSIFGAAAFGQFVLAAPLLCLSAFILTTSSDRTEIMTRLLYFGCISGQLFFYCFCGNMIKTESDRVATAAYNCSWESTSVRTQKTLKLLILRGQKTMSVVAGNLFELSMVTFGALLKSSYSFFAVLNKKHDD